MVNRNKICKWKKKNKITNLHIPQLLLKTLKALSNTLSKFILFSQTTQDLMLPKHYFSFCLSCYRESHNKLCYFALRLNPSDSRYKPQQNPCTQCEFRPHSTIRFCHMLIASSVTSVAEDAVADFCHDSTVTRFGVWVRHEALNSGPSLWYHSQIDVCNKFPRDVIIFNELILSIINTKYRTTYVILFLRNYQRYFMSAFMW